MLRKIEALTAQWGWAVLLALVPVLLTLTFWRSLGLLLVPVVVFLVLRQRARTVVIPAERQLDGPVLALAVMVLVSLGATFDILQSATKAAGLVLGIGLYYAVSAAGRVGGTRWALGLLAGYLLLGCAIAVVGLLGMALNDKFLGGASWLTAVLPRAGWALPGAEAGLQPNEVGGVLLWFVPLAWALLAGAIAHWGPLRQQWGEARVSGVLFVLFGIVGWLTGILGLTQSRSALVGLVVGLVALGLWVGGWVRRVTAGLLVVGVVGGGWVFGAQASALVRFMQEARAESAGPGQLYSNLEQRSEIWTRAWLAIQDAPLTGVGLNAFRVLLPTVYPPLSGAAARDLAHAHNTLLQVALDVGVPGLLAYVVLHGFGVSALWAARQRRATPWVWRVTALGVLSCWVSFAIYGLTDTVALGARPGFAWWILLALGVMTVWLPSEKTPVVGP